MPFAYVIIRGVEVGLDWNGSGYAQRLAGVDAVVNILRFSYTV